LAPSDADPTTPDAAIVGPADPAADAAVGAADPPLADDPEAERRAIASGAQDPIMTLLALGRADLGAQRLGSPPGRNAMERYRLALRLAERFRSSADAERARQGLVEVAVAYTALAERELGAGKPEAFMDFQRRAAEAAAAVPEGADLAARIAQRNAALRDEALELARKAVADWDRDAARAAFERALVFDPASTTAQRGLRGVDRIGRPGYVFRDALGAGEGPEMVVVEVAGRRLAAARSETTVAEFRAFWADGGAAARAERPACRDREGFFRSSRSRGFQAPGIEQDASHPVVCVAAADADAYVEWLSRRTGKRYRLPTADEWLALAARAPAPDACKSNLADAAFRAKYRDNDALACDDGFAASAPVRRFDAPAGAVYDIAGNVREWVSDCPPNCRERTAMGSAWHSAADGAEPTQRTTFARDVASNTVGFRVVREID
jgi:hypothetical protein